MANLNDYNLLEDQTRECPFAYFQAIRRDQPIFFMKELGAWYVSRYEDLRYVKKHPELFSNDVFVLAKDNPMERNVAERYKAENGWKRVSTLQRTDPPVHTKYRQLINQAFTVKRVRGMYELQDLLDQLLTGGNETTTNAIGSPMMLHLQRVATEDTELGGVRIPKGARLALGYASANRDEEIFEDGETFDATRNKAGAHLAFGSGPHHCPGASAY